MRIIYTALKYDTNLHTYKKLDDFKLRAAQMVDYPMYKDEVQVMRAVIEDDTIISGAFCINVNGAFWDVILLSDADPKISSYDSDHHHITKISEEISEYYYHFNGTPFKIASLMDSNALQTRFPLWSHHKSMNEQTNVLVYPKHSEVGGIIV